MFFLSFVAIGGTTVKMIFSEVDFCFVLSHYKVDFWSFVNLWLTATGGDFFFSAGPFLSNELNKTKQNKAEDVMFGDKP